MTTTHYTENGKHSNSNTRKVKNCWKKVQLPMLLSLTYFKYIFFVTKLSFFPKFCLPRKPSLLLEEDGPNKTKRDEQELNHQRGNGVGKFMATTKREREGFDLCGISDVTRTERGIYYTL